MNNKTFENQPISIFAGNYPVENENLILEEEVVAGDVIGVDENCQFGKFGEDYPQVFGVALEDSGVKVSTGEIFVTAILTGTLNGAFVQLPEGEEDKTKIELRKLGIFIK